MYMYMYIYFPKVSTKFKCKNNIKINCLSLHKQFSIWKGMKKITIYSDIKN